jgi:hypothetical protein
MRTIHVLGLSSALALGLACSGGHGQGFGSGPDGGSGSDGGSGGPGDGGCAFCGIDATAPDGGGTFVCTPNPANFDIPGNNCDDDGDGVVDNPQGACDTGLPAANPTAAQLAMALGLCPNKGDTWGVTSATYTQGYNNTKAPDAQQYGTSGTFGTNVKARQGSALGILSTGVAAAQDCSSNNGVFKGANCTSTGAGAAPPGYPKPATVNNKKCPLSNVANDVVNLKLQIKVPANAKGFSFDFNFYSGEWPEFECTTFNDSFVAWLTSTAWQGKTGDFNISFDGNNNPVSVNNSFFDVCSPAGLACPNMPTPSTCKLGANELLGTGFYSPGTYCGLKQDSGGGATGWLTTQAPVAPGETITLQFMIWNTGDEAYDSSVLLDNWQWTAGDTSVSTTRPPN